MSLKGDAEAVERIQENGGEIGAEDSSTQTLWFRISPIKLTSELLERLGLVKIAIANTDTSANVSTWIRKIRDMFSGITIEADCVTSENPPRVEASYALVCKRALQAEVNQALQALKQPELTGEAASSSESTQSRPGI